MKLDPVGILLNKNFKSDKKFYFISGNEKTLIEKTKDIIIKNYQAHEKASLINIDSIDSPVDAHGLFEDKKIFLVNSIKGINEKNLNRVRDTAGIFVFVEENSTKIKEVKKLFIKDSDSLSVDCYELDRGSKIKVLNDFIILSKLDIEKDIYWFLVEKLDNRYGFLDNSLSKILELNQGDITLTNIKKIITVDNSSKERVFFNLLKKNKEIIQVYKEKILTPSDVNELYYFSKIFCNLIIVCKDEGEYNKRIPIYLFKEKSFLIDIYNRYNSKKKKMLINLLYTTETILRKESGLSLALGLRFLLNLRRITIS